MSEIEKMYGNAGVKTDRVVCYRGFDNCIDNDFNCHCHNEKPCKDATKIYPPFTAEKQIAVIMFILNKFGDIGFQEMYSIRGNDETTRKDFIKCLCDCEHETIDSRPVDFYYQNGANGDNLEESIAGLINTLWQDLTEEERKEIKSILQGV